MEFIKGVLGLCFNNREEEGTAPQTERKAEIEMEREESPIRDQMEFYFSDPNLESDYFLRNLIASSSEGYINVSRFKNLARIKRLLATEDQILNACLGSKFLEVDIERKMIKRSKPFVRDPHRIDRTILISGFNPSEDIESLYNILAPQLGDINRISLKHHIDSNLNRVFSGTAIVEMKTAESAKNAILEGFQYEGKQLFPRSPPSAEKK